MWLPLSTFLNLLAIQWMKLTSYCNIYLSVFPPHLYWSETNKLSTCLLNFPCSKILVVSSRCSNPSMFFRQELLHCSKYLHCYESVCILQSSIVPPKGPMGVTLQPAQDSARSPPPKSRSFRSRGEKRLTTQQITIKAVGYQYLRVYMKLVFRISLLLYGSGELL